MKDWTVTALRQKFATAPAIVTGGGALALADKGGEDLTNKLLEFT